MPSKEKHNNHCILYNDNSKYLCYKIRIDKFVMNKVPDAENLIKFYRDVSKVRIKEYAKKNNIDINNKMRSGLEVDPYNESILYIVTTADIERTKDGDEISRR
jgi:hypothetical protein